MKSKAVADLSEQDRPHSTAQHGRTESVVPVLAFLDRLHLTVI